MPYPILIGLILAAVMVIAGGYRFWTGQETRVLRNADGSMYGGLVRVTLLQAILWFAIGAGVTWLIGLLV